MEMQLRATVTLDASPALLESLAGLAEAIQGAKETQKSRVRGPKSAKEARDTAATEKARENAEEETKPEKSSQASEKDVNARKAAEPASFEPPKGSMPQEQIPPVSLEDARQAVIETVQEYGNPEELRKKMESMGFAGLHAMPDAARADFIDWVRATYPAGGADKEAGK